MRGEFVGEKFLLYTLLDVVGIFIVWQLTHSWSALAVYGFCDVFTLNVYKSFKEK